MRPKGRRPAIFAVVPRLRGPLDRLYLFNYSHLSFRRIFLLGDLQGESEKSSRHFFLENTFYFIIFSPLSPPARPLDPAKRKC